MGDYSLHFPSKETEAQRGGVACPGLRAEEGSPSAGQSAASRKPGRNVAGYHSKPRKWNRQAAAPQRPKSLSSLWLPPLLDRVPGTGVFALPPLHLASCTFAFRAARSWIICTKESLLQYQGNCNSVIFSTLSTFHLDGISLTFPCPSEACATCNAAIASTALGKQSSSVPGLEGLRLCSDFARVVAPKWSF